MLAFKMDYFIVGKIAAFSSVLVWSNVVHLIFKMRSVSLNLRGVLAKKKFQILLEFLCFK